MAGAVCWKVVVAPMIGGWRSVFYITGGLGLVVALLIYFGVKEMPRGKAEPRTARPKPSMRALPLQRSLPMQLPAARAAR